MKVLNLRDNTDETYCKYGAIGITVSYGNLNSARFTNPMKTTFKYTTQKKLLSTVLALLIF